LKSATYEIGSKQWFLFSGIFLGLALVLLPALYASAVWLSDRLERQKTDLRKSLAHYSQVLVPLGLMAWIAFTVSFAFTKFSYVLPVVSDPLGWGWNLIGMTGLANVGQTTSLNLLIQTIVLAAGLFWSSRVAFRISATLKSALPLIAISGIFSLAMLWLLVG
jgi:hypothetical protein